MNSLYVGKLSESIRVFDRKHFVWGHFSDIVYHLKQQKWQDTHTQKKCHWILRYLKTNLSSCIYVHFISKCSALDYFYKYIPLKQPIIFDNETYILVQSLLQSVFSYSGEIMIFPGSFENKCTLLKLFKAKKEHKTQVNQAQLSSWKINQPQDKMTELWYSMTSFWQCVSVSNKYLATCFHFIFRFSKYCSFTVQTLTRVLIITVFFI